MYNVLYKYDAATPCFSMWLSLERGVWKSARLFFQGNPAASLAQKEM